MAWNFRVDDSAEIGYDMTLGRYPITALGLNLKLFKRVIKGGGGTIERFTIPMVDLDLYSYMSKCRKITPKEYFIYSYL